MSKLELNSSMLNSTIDIYRKEYVTSDVGDASEVSVPVYSAIAALIQPKVSELFYEIEGNTFVQTHICYLNKDALEIKPNDIVKDVDTGINYTVISIDEFKIASTPATVHHIRLALEALGEDGIAIDTGGVSSSKVHIHH